MQRLNESTPFTLGVDAVRAASTRTELVVNEIAAPDGLAPFSFALSADISPAAHSTDSEHGTGRFVLLHDPESPEAWGGQWRVVCFAQAPLETEMGIDPFLADVTWAWLMDALSSRNAIHSAASGTTTKVLSTGYGELADQGDGAVIEVRASWSPVITPSLVSDRGSSESGPGTLGAHAEAWTELLALLAGLPPAEGVTSLAHRRAARA